MNFLPNAMGLDVLGSQSLDIGVGIGPGGDDSVPLQVNPQREYVAVIPSFFEGPLRDDPIGGPHGWHGVAEYERMFHTPAVGSSFNALRASVLSGGAALLPAVKRTLGNAKPGQVAGTGPEEAMAAEIAESNRRTILAWRTPLPTVLWEGLEAMYLGHMLAERTMRDVAGGPDDGLLAVKSLRWLPRSSYRFRVDRASNVIGINAYAWDDTLDDGKGGFAWQLLDPANFAVLTWDSYRNDPRGRSIFRMAHYHWRMLMDLWPEVFKGWKQFGTPWTYSTTAPNSKMVPAVDAKGKPTPGQPAVTAEYAAAMAAMGMRNGSAAAGPHGSDIKVIESTKDSSVVSGAVDILEGQIIRAILLQLRATVEAKHGSRADSQTGQDIMGTLVRFVRMWLERFVRSVLMAQNALNYGDEIARRLTPLVDLGGTEHQDFAANSAGVGVLFQAGYFTEAQLPEVDTMLGLPQRQAGDLRVGPTGELPADDSAVNPDGTPKALPAPDAEPAVAMSDDPEPEPAPAKKARRAKNSPIIADEVVRKPRTRVYKPKGGGE